MNINKRTVVQYIAVIVVTILIATVIQAVWPKADAYCVDAPARAQGQKCAPFTPKRGVKKFRKGHLDNLAGLRLPKKLVRKLERRYDGRGRLGHERGVKDWWEKVQESASCYVYNRDWWLQKGAECIGDTYTKPAGKALRSTTKTVLTCGGSAVLGYFVVKKMVPDGNDADLDPTWKVKRKGWHMIAAATTACTFDTLWKKWF